MEKGNGNNGYPPVINHGNWTCPVNGGLNLLNWLKWSINGGFFHCHVWLAEDKSSTNGSFSMAIFHWSLTCIGSWRSQVPMLNRSPNHGFFGDVWCVEQNLYMVERCWKGLQLNHPKLRERSLPIWTPLQYEAAKRHQCQCFQGVPPHLATHSSRLPCSDSVGCATL